MAARDRHEAHNDFEINRNAEEEIRAVLEHPTAQDAALTKIVEALVAVQAKNGNGGAAQP